MTPSVNLLPPEYRRDKYRPTLVIGVPFGAIVLALAIWTFVLTGQRASLRHQLADLGQTTAQHATALDHYRTLKELEGRLTGISSDAGKPAVQRSVVMREVLRLAANVRIEGITVAGGGEVVISGETEGLLPIAAYLERLGQSTVLGSPALTVTSRDALSGALRFEVICSVKGGGQ